MKKRRQLTHWQCNFCNQHLRKKRLLGPQLLSLLLLCRPVYCRHCFANFLRPLEFWLILKRVLRATLVMPFVRTKWLLRKVLSRKRIAPDNVERVLSVPVDVTGQPTG